MCALKRGIQQQGTIKSAKERKIYGTANKHGRKDGKR
jgi:ribosomal protein S21